MVSAFGILTRKNIKTEIRRWRILVIEVVIIVIIYVIIVINPVARSTEHDMDTNIANQTKFYKEYDVDTLLPLAELLDLKSSPIMFKLAFTPNNEFTKNLIKGVASKLLLEATVGYETEELLESQYNEKDMLAAVVFPPDTKTLPKHLLVTLRFPSNFRTIDSDDISLEEKLWATRCSGVLTGEENDEDNHIQADLYIREGFLQLQHMIFLEWFQMILNKTDPPSFPQVNASSFRHHTTKNICKLASTSNLILFLHAFAFFYPYLNLIWIYGRELEENILVHCWKHGIEYSTHWFSHCFVSLLHFIILDFCIVIILKIDWYDSTTTRAYHDVDSFFLFLFLIVYNVALIVCVIVIVSMFLVVKNALLFGLALWLSIYGLCAVVLAYSFNITSLPVLLSFVGYFNNAYPFGMRYLKDISQVKDKSEHWILIGILIINILAHMCLLLLVQYCKPGRYVANLPFDCFGIRRRCGKLRVKGKRRMIKFITLKEPPTPWQNLEYGPLDGKHLVRLKQISTFVKTDKESYHFIKNISLRVWKGEVTVILGHSHSGKTTLISITAGLHKPEVGWVLYELGGDIFETWADSRHLVDICMPNHPLFDYLTVAESLSFYTRLKIKDFSQGKLDMEVHKWINMLKPVISNRNLLVRHLSHDQKRLLCLCCAMTCDTRIILIDEPTMGMAVQEKRLFWSILKREKPDRAILITTFSISEAEGIGDRIGILDNGSLKAYGTPFFLKTTFGVGYDLVILRNNTNLTDAVTEVIRIFIPGIVPDNEIGDQLFYKLPSSKGGVFQTLLINLEKDKKYLGIEDVRIVGSSLSEIAMTVCKRKNNQDIPVCSKPSKGVYLSEGLRKQQISAMMYKKILYQAPNIIPIVMIFFAFFLIVITNQLSKVFHVPPIRHNSIILGLNTTETSRKFMSDFSTCNFTDIQSVDHGDVFAKMNAPSLIFTKDSFFCGKDTFEEFLKKDKIIYNKYGAVEKLDSVDKESLYICWINQHMFHSAPLTLNLLHNLLLQEELPQDLSYLTTITNDPMPIPLDYKINLLDHQMSHLRLPLTIGIIIPITISCFIIPIVHEKTHHLIILEILAGVNASVYWIVTLLWDICTFLTYTILFLITMTMTTLEGFGFYDKILTMLLLNIYGIAALAQTYFISLFFYKSVYQSYMISVIIQFVTGICAYVFYWDVIETNNIFFHIASLSPTFSLLDGVSNIYSATKEQEYCRNRCERFSECNSETICNVLPTCCFDTFFKLDDPGILLSIIYMCSSATLFMIMIFFVHLYRTESRYHIPKWKKKLQTACYTYDDPEVVDIKKRIAESDLRACLHPNLVVDQLETIKPIEGNKIFTISFSLDASTCMAIYGPPKSGKSDLIKKLIGETRFGFGDVFIHGTELKYEPDESYKHLGYVPQASGYYEVFTTRELLRFFCMLRGVHTSKIADITQNVAMSLDMLRWLDRKIGTLTYEKRRKVNIALALVPYSEVVIIDEPTRGLPMHTRREIWNVLRYERYCGRTIIFTTLDPEECEALADYVLMYNDGEMLAYGSSYQLRKRGNKGFILEVKLKRDGDDTDMVQDNLRKDAENLNRFVVYLHEEAVLRTRIDNCMRFYLPVKKTSYSNLFGAIEKNRKRLNIQQYTVSQGSLDDVMANLTADRLEARQNKAK